GESRRDARTLCLRLKPGLHWLAYQSAGRYCNRDEGKVAADFPLPVRHLPVPVILGADEILYAPAREQGELVEVDLPVPVDVGLPAEPRDDEVKEDAVLQCIALVGQLPFRATEQGRHAPGRALALRAGDTRQGERRAPRPGHDRIVAAGIAQEQLAASRAVVDLAELNPQLEAGDPHVAVPDDHFSVAPDLQADRVVLDVRHRADNEVI